MAIYFIKNNAIVATPSDSNDGRDPCGFGLTTATYNDTTKTLTQTNAFTSYTWTSGDQIYISGGTGATVGLYTIASKTDASNIVLASSAGTTDATGNWTSSSGPFSTIAHGFNGSGTGVTLAAGDEVRVCADADHVLSAMVQMTSDGAFNTDFIYFYGATSNGVVDGTQATIRPTTSAMTALIDMGTTSVVTWNWFENLIFDGDDSGAVARATYCIDTTVTGGTGDLNFTNCDFLNATSHGILLRGNGFNFENCRAHDNGGTGFECQTDASHGMMCAGCTAYNNGGEGFGLGIIRTLVSHCIAYGNTGDGFKVSTGSSSNECMIVNCTAYNNGSDGFHIGNRDSTTAGTCCINCSSSGNTAYGFLIDGTGMSDVSDIPRAYRLWGYNHSYNNTSGHTNLTGTFADSGEGMLTSDPSFTAAGSADFSLASGSPLIAAGLNGSDIGAAGNADGGGGGAAHPVILSE